MRIRGRFGEVVGFELVGAKRNCREEDIYTWHYAMELAGNLREEADELTLDAAAGVAVPYIGEFISGGLEGAATMYRVWAKNLENCALIVSHFKPMGMCWIYTKSVDLKIGEVYVSVKEQPCPWKGGHKKNLEWFDCGKRGEWQG